MPSTYTGVEQDPRSENEKMKDWSHEELGFSATPFIWKEFNEDGVPQYPIRNQDGSGMCGPFAGSKALGVRAKKRWGKFVNLLPPFIYQLRTNKSSGMWLQQLLEIMCGHGAPLDENLKGDNLNEEQANNFVILKEMFDEAFKYGGGKYAFINPKDVDEIARVIDMGWTPILLLRCDVSEWTSEPQANPSFDDQHEYTINHFVPAVYAGRKNGVRTIVVDDSWGSSYGKNGRRDLSDDFILRRVEAVGYVFDLPEDSAKPKHTFFQQLPYGLRNNTDVVALQNILKYEGCMDKTVPSTGNYLNITAAAVLKMQIKNEIDILPNLIALQGKNVGPKTLAYLAKAYS